MVRYALVEWLVERVGDFRQEPSLADLGGTIGLSKQVVARLDLCSGNNTLSFKQNSHVTSTNSSQLVV